MGFHQEEQQSNLALEPMEDRAEEGPFGSFSSSDLKMRVEEQSPSTVEPAKKIEGKANFYTEDRQLGERRFSERRRMVRLTGDRRSGQTRRLRPDRFDFATSS